MNILKKGAKMGCRLIYVIFVFLALFFYSVPCQAIFDYCTETSEEQILSLEEIQLALSDLGYYQGQINGQYDQTTKKAIKNFQKAIGLAVDGQIKYHLWIKLAQTIEIKEKKVATVKLESPTGEVSIIIDTFRRKLIILDGQKPFIQFPVAIGKTETPSPLGNWKIIHKAAHWGTGFGTRWMGLNVPWGIYGIHGTNKPWSIGTMASHGCFRMFNKDVETIYPWVKSGTAVYVVGNPFSYISGGVQRLHMGIKCSAVTYVQEKLINKGYYQGKADGIFGSATEKSILQLQEKSGLEKSGQVGYPEYEALGINLR